MKIALAIPAYRQHVHIKTAYAWAQDMASAMEMGWRPLLLWNDINGIERARNIIVKQAYEADARLLLMCDSDNFPALPQGGLAEMWKAMSEHGAAVVGAAIPVRQGDMMNCEPAKPGEVYPGVVGTGYMLIDLVKLRTMPRPWFSSVIAEDGIEKTVGSDINFCRRVQEHGQSVIVHFALPMAHAETSAVGTRF